MHFITNGTFRLGLHVGHLYFFKSLSKQDCQVTVFLDTKERVQQIKPNTFCLSDCDRFEILSSCKYIQDVKLFNSAEDLHSKIENLLIQNKEKFCYVKGDEYDVNKLSVKPLMEKYGHGVITVPMLQGYSTTGLIKTLQGQK
jgi:bifunctional ADP-heptose synthase (sugar kinase/adenylyltransferase)